MRPTTTITTTTTTTNIRPLHPRISLETEHTIVLNRNDLNRYQPSVSSNIWHQPGHRLSNIENNESIPLINIEVWDENIRRMLEELEERNGVIRTALENEPLINTDQLNQGEIEANIYQREATNENFQVIINANTNPDRSEIMNRQSIVRAWSDQLQVESNQQIENLNQEAQRINNEITTIENNVIERAESRIENATNHAQFWNRINNALSFLETPSFLGSLTLTFVVTLGGLIVRGALQNPNSRFSSIIPNLFRLPRPTNPNSTPQIQSQPEINPSRIASQVYQQSGIPHPPTSDISDWSQRPN